MTARVMTPRRAEYLRAWNRWRARAYAALFIIMRRRVAIDPDLLREAQDYSEGLDRKPVVLVAHHTLGMYLMLQLFKAWSGRTLVFASNASSRYLHFLKWLRIIPKHLEVCDKLTLRDLHSLSKGDVVLFALADVNVGKTKLFHYAVGGRLRTFSCDWAEIANRLRARVVCLRIQLRGWSGSISYRDVQRGTTIYETAASALDWFFDSHQHEQEWDFYAAGALEPEIKKIDDIGDLQSLYMSLASSAMHHITPVDEI